MDSEKNAKIAIDNLQDVFIKEANGKMNIFFSQVTKINVYENSDGIGIFL